MARPRSTNHRRTLSESEQREFVEFDQQQRQHNQQHQRLFQFDHTQGLDGPVRRFEILKSTPLGLVFPQNLYLSVVDVDAGIAQTGHLFDLSTSSHEPVFVTSELKWWKNKYILPPSFEVFPGLAHEHATGKKTGRRKDLQPSEITGLTPCPRHERFNSTPDLNDKPYPLAKVKYKGWQGLTRMSISLTLYNITPEMHYHHEYSHHLSQDLDSTPAIRSQCTIARTGWKREYILSPGSYKWRSPSVDEKKDILSTPAVDDSSPIGHGNLILEDPKARVVAVYKQRRDYEVLGSLTVFINHVVRKDDRDGSKISVESVVASCLAVVTYERVGWQNLLGH